MSVLAYPSRDLDSRTTEAERARVERQKARLGPEGLAAATKAVEEAVESQRLPPKEVLKKVPVAGVEGITFRRMGSYDLAKGDQVAKGFDLRWGGLTVVVIVVVVFVVVVVVAAAAELCSTTCNTHQICRLPHFRSVPFKIHVGDMDTQFVR